jgi:hypothetical protein
MAHEMVAAHVGRYVLYRYIPSEKIGQPVVSLYIVFRKDVALFDTCFSGALYIK